MALRWMDNFQSYGGIKAYLLNGVYAEAYGNVVDDPDPAADVTSFAYASFGQFGAGESTSLRWVLPATETTVGVAFRNWFANLPGNASQSKTVTIADGANNALLYTYITTTGVIQVKNGAGAVLGASAGPVIVANAWQHIEMKAVFDTVAGSIEVRIEGVPVITVAGINTGAGPAAQVRIDNYSDGGGGGVVGYVKDLAIWDGSGAHITDFVGTCSVISLRPDADVALNWTSTGANGFSVINEATPNDATFISANNVPPAAYQCSLGDLPADIVGIRGVMAFARMRKSDAGDANVQMTAVSSTDHTDGVNRPLTTAWTYWSDVFMVDPHTNAAWTQAGVNAMNLKLNRTV